MTISGGWLRKIVAMPATIPTSPQRRHRPCHRHSQSPPNATSTSPQTGSRGVCQTLPGSAETRSPTQIVASMPQPIGTSPNRSSPNGINRHETTPQGSVHIAESGTAMTLASGEYKTIL